MVFERPSQPYRTLKENTYKIVKYFKMVTKYRPCWFWYANNMLRKWIGSYIDANDSCFYKIHNVIGPGVKRSTLKI